MDERKQLTAKMMLVAVTANNGLINHPQKLVKTAIELSDALLKEFNKEEETNEIEKKNNA